MLSSLETTALVAAGVVAGLVGTAGGITSSVSYPVLLAVGLPALPASIANNIALVACWPGSALASQPELRGRGKWLRRWSLVAVAGGAAGAALLLLTSDRAFARIAPLLIVTGSLALLFEPRLTAWRQGRHPGGSSLPLAVGLFVISVYNGYFGGGSGIMVLTLMLVLIDHHVAPTRSRTCSSVPRKSSAPSSSCSPARSSGPPLRRWASACSPAPPLARASRDACRRSSFAC